MNKYQNNIKSLDNLRKVNKKLNHIELSLKKKYLRNKRQTEDLDNLMEDTLEKYHSIIKNLDNVVFN